MPLIITPGITITGGITIAPESGGGGAYATGGTIYDITGYKVHIFNSSGTFATTASWPSGRTIEYLVVAGGGGASDGGGGAGGLLSSNGVTAAASTNYAVTIGAGGIVDTNGANTSLIGGAISVTSIGGGAGGIAGGPNPGQAGGSGGGGATTGNGTSGSGGAGTPGQGTAGGDASGKYSSSSSGWGGGAGYSGSAYPNRGDGLVSNMITAYSASTITIPAFSISWALYTFTVSAGLPFQANSAVYVSNNATPSISLMGRVNSYSGTTMVCQLDRYDPGGSAATLSGWNISFAHAGGGPGIDQGSTTTPATLGGSGGQYGSSYPSDFYNGLPNSGGGASSYQTGTGGSGVVMIKYAYP